MLHGHADMKDHIIKRPSKINKLSDKAAGKLDKFIQQRLMERQNVKR